MSWKSSTYVSIRKALIGTGIGKFRVINYINNVLLTSLKKDYTIVLGNKMYLDSHDALELSLNGIYEPMETALIQQLIGPGDNVVDIGAHIGYYTLIMSKLVGPTGTVFAFEPDKTNFELLRKNVEVNGCTNVMLENMVITDTVEPVRLFNIGESSNPTIVGSGEQFTLVDGTSLDTYFRGIKINFIKMDVEGAEYLVLKGATRILQTDVKIVTEFYPKVLPVTAMEFLDLLNGFNLYVIDEESKSVTPTTPPVLGQDYSSSNGRLTNLLCTKVKL